MNNMKTLPTWAAGTALATVLLTAFSVPAAADDSGWYLGANVGATLSTYSRSGLDNALTAAFSDELAVTSSALDKPSTIWWADVGYMFSPNVGIEASYLDLRTLKYDAAGTRTNPLGSSQVTAHLDIKSQGPALALVGALPLWNACTVDARAGVYAGKTSTDYTSQVGTTSNAGSESTTAGSVLLGIGASYRVATHLALRLDYLYIHGIHEKVLAESFNASVLTAGVTYAF
jgi:OOP family OmpA-OmpF porin